MPRRVARRILLPSHYAMFGVALLLTACATPGQDEYSADAIEARVVDEQTGQPLEGVVVVANWLLMGGTAGGRSQLGPLMVLEAISDATGKFFFPAWGPLPNRTSGYLDNADPELWLFTSGYYFTRRANDYTTDYRKKPSRRKSEFVGKTIPLKRFAGNEDAYADHVATTGWSLAANLKWYEDCTIARTPALAAALDRENTRLERGGFDKGGFSFRRLTPQFKSRCQISVQQRGLQ